MTPAPAVTVVQFAVDLLVGAVIFVLAVVVTALVLRLVQIVLPAPDSGAEALRRAEAETAGGVDPRGEDSVGVEPAAGAGGVGTGGGAGVTGAGRVGPGAEPRAQGSASPHAMGGGTEGSDREPGRRA